MGKPTIDGLREQVRGDVITRDDQGYEEARTVYNAMIDRHPRVVVRPVDVADVTATVNFARENELDLSIRGGSHSVPGFGTCDDGAVIDLSGMRGVRVDPKTKTARAEGGATWGDLDHAAHGFGLATTGGIISTTGIGGLTLGGGIGYLARGFGLSCDNLLSCDVVTADGTSRSPSLCDSLHKNPPHQDWSRRVKRSSTLHESRRPIRAPSADTGDLVSPATPRSSRRTPLRSPLGRRRSRRGRPEWRRNRCRIMLHQPRGPTYRHRRCGVESRGR